MMIEIDVLKELVKELSSEFLKLCETDRNLIEPESVVQMIVTPW